MGLTLEQLGWTLGGGVVFSVGFGYLMNSIGEPLIDQFVGYLVNKKNSTRIQRENRMASKGKPPYKDGQLFLDFYSN